MKTPNLTPKDQLKLRLIYQFHRRGYPASIMCDHDDLEIIAYRHFMDLEYCTERERDGHSFFDFTAAGIEAGRALEHDETGK